MSNAKKKRMEGRKGEKGGRKKRDRFQSCENKLHGLGEVRMVPKQEL